MAVNKLPEFAKNGQKNTDGLNQEDGFPVNLKPARQWFNYLFNKLALTVNQIIDEDYIRHNEIVDNLTTDDSKKPLSAKQGESLNEKKVDVGKSFSDSFAKDVDYYQDKQTEQYFKSFDDFPLGSRILVAKELNLINTPEISDQYFYVETKTTYMKSSPGRLQIAHGYATGAIAVRSAFTNANYNEWKYIATIASNVASATKLATPRTVSFSGAATGSFTYDGSANSSCILTLSNSGVIAGTYASTIQIPSIAVNNKGQITGISQQTVRSASVTQTGVVQLVDDLVSDDQTKALTAKQGKILQDIKLDKTTNAIGVETKENRTLKPNQLQPRSMQSVFGTLNSDNSTQYADFLTLNGWDDISGGVKNALVFSKTTQELFHFQAPYNSQTWTIKRKIAYTDNQTFTGTNKFTGDVQVDGAIYSQNFRGESDFWFVSNSGGIAKKVLSGGLLASSNYIDSEKVPELGIYSKGHIYTSSDVCADTYRGYAGMAKFTGNLDGKLLNARMINGVAFDASYDINIPPVSFYITAGANLNNYQSTGFFFQDADAVAQQIANVPVQSAFALRVERSAGCSQWFTPYNGSGVTYYRHYYSGNWSNWIVLKPNNVTLSGAVTGTATFDSAGNISIPTNLQVGVGINQYYQDLTGARYSGVVYTNNTGNTITLIITASGSNSTALTHQVNGVQFINTNESLSRTITYPVPNGASYIVTAATIHKWSELR